MVGFTQTWKLEPVAVIATIFDFRFNSDFVFFFFVATQQVSCSCGNKVLQGTSQALPKIIMLRDLTEISLREWKEQT